MKNALQVIPRSKLDAVTGATGHPMTDPWSVNNPLSPMSQLGPGPSFWRR